MIVIYLWLWLSLKIGFSWAINDVTNIYVRENTTVTLVCELNKDDEEPIWKGPKNDTTYAIETEINDLLPKRDRLNIIQRKSPPQLNLQIQNFSIADEGSYKCVSTNKDGVINRIDFLVLMQRDPRNMTVHNEQPGHLLFGYVNRLLTLKCSVIAGIPQGSIEWKSGNTSVSIGRNDFAIYSFKPKLSDQHRHFTCIAKNNFTLNPIQRTLQLFLYELPRVDIKQGSELNVTEGNVLRLDCRISSNHEILNITWEYTNCESESKKMIFSKRTLRYDNTTRNQTGKYKCIAANHAGAVEDEIDVIVQYAPDVRVVYNHTASLERHFQCIPNGFPDTYTFYDWEHKSEFNEHIRYIDGNGTGTLKLPNVAGETDRHHDRGIYVCRVSNGIHFKGNYVSTKEYFFNATGKPYFVKSNNINHFRTAQQATQLFVMFVSIPEFTKIRVFNKSLISTDVMFETKKSAETCDVMYGKNVSVSVTNVTLVLKPYTSKGVWQHVVEVSNSYGSRNFSINVQLRNCRDTANTYNYKIGESVICYDTFGVKDEVRGAGRTVQVKRAPDIPTEIRTLSRPNEVLVYWKPGKNGGYEQLFHVKYRKSDDDNWKTHSAGDSNSTVIRDLLPNTEYYIQLFATNKIGTSTVTEQYPIKTADKSSEGTVLILITTIIILVVIIVMICSVKGLKKVMRRKKANQSGASIQEIEVEDTISQYDEINSTTYAPVRNVTLQRTEVEVQFIPHNEIVMLNTEYDTDRSESQICISEIVPSLSDPDSEDESSEISYLYPGKPYTELEFARNNTQSLHSYEKLNQRIPSQIYLPSNLMISAHSEKRLKRLTI